MSKHQPRVSIHTPAWGATGVFLKKSASREFQSTHPHGVRLTREQIGIAAQEFQSTHPHGVRHHSVWVLCLQIRFQSTHPHGVRLKPLPPSHFSQVSIHAPAWGATSYYSKRWRILCFNPRTRMGCDTFWRYAANCGAFQSTHPHGVRHIFTKE